MVFFPSSMDLNLCENTGNIRVQRGPSHAPSQPDVLPPSSLCKYTAVPHSTNTDSTCSTAEPRTTNTEISPLRYYKTNRKYQNIQNDIRLQFSLFQYGWNNE